jgi:GNAT superfamily N-acetyltransferase
LPTDTTAMPDPKLAVSLLTPDEAEQYMRIRHAAFVHDVNKIFYFHQPEPSQATLDSVTQSIRDGIAKGTLYLKCVDTSNGDIIAGARWRYIGPNDPNATSRTWDEVNAELAIPEMYAESHPEVWRAFYELFNDSKRKHMGARPYWVLDTLVTHPDHHRRGAGGLLLRWGCDKADEAGTETYLEASEMGEPLYRRYGFEPVENIALDLRNWGGPEEIRWTVSRRDPD